ncbi:MAG: PorT family protein [Tannerellaceae bacterium]|jgi:hypothetical protein|nr:PorT family protein [Tannerellaceae bacterium]
MRKLFITTSLLLACMVGVFAQNMQFGVRVGANISSVSFNENVDGIKSKTGLQAGITLDVQINENVYLLTGLDVAQKGTKLSGSDDGVSLTITGNPLYVIVPVHVGYKMGLTGATLMPHAGLYFAYGLSGKLNAKGTSDGVSASVDAGDYFEDGLFKPVDLGLGIGATLEIGKLNFNLGYDLGLANIADEADVTAKNGSVFLTVGYKF